MDKQFMDSMSIKCYCTYMKRLEVIRTRRAGKWYIALMSPSRTIVAMGTFPVNCPGNAIASWINDKQIQYS